MALSDLRSCLDEVSAAAPAGTDIQYDPEYRELLKLAEGKPETQWTAAEEPNWREVSKSAIALLKRSKELRVVSLLTLASLKTDGVPGIAAGLELFKEILEKYWDTLYPALDEDDGDPTERINIIASLSPPPGTYGDTMLFRQRLREAPLTASARLGKFGLRDVAIALGKAPAIGNVPVTDSKTIDGAFDDTPTTYLQEIQEAARRGSAAVKGIDQLLTEKVGAGKSPDLSDFDSVLGEIVSTTAKYLARRGIGAGPSVNPGTSPSTKTEASAMSLPTAFSVAVPGSINSDKDVLETLERLCDYYKNNEPSSPVPLLLKRAKRLVSKSFIEILRDLSPDSMGRLEIISGPEAEEQKN